jgi:hypothetical protein
MPTLGKRAAPGAATGAPPAAAASAVSAPSPFAAAARPRTGAGQFPVVAWAPGLSRYSCVYFNNGRWAVALAGRKVRFSRREEAESCFESLWREIGLDPAARLRPGWRESDEAKAEAALADAATVKLMHD